MGPGNPPDVGSRLLNPLLIRLKRDYKLKRMSEPADTLKIFSPSHMTGLIGSLKALLSPAARRRLRTLFAHILPQPRRVSKLMERVSYLENHNAKLTDAVITGQKKLQEKGALDYQILMTHQGLLAEFRDLEPQFQESYERCTAYTMTSVERLYSLHKCVEYLVDASIAGDLAECGIWRGGSCMMMAQTLLASGDRDRRILMYDTYEGHPQPDPERDIDLWGNSGYEEWRRQTSEGQVKGWGCASLKEVRENMQTTGYPDDKLEYVKGMVEETVPVHIPERLALLRLDTDWYKSTRVALVYLYPKLVTGGVLVIDDYGHYRGQRQAVDEYFAAAGGRPLLHRIDYSCRVAVKSAP